MKLAGEREQRFVQLIEIRIHSIIPRLPWSFRFFRVEPNHRIIAGGLWVVAKVRKVLSHVCRRMVLNDRFALIHRKNGSEHALVFRVWLAEVEIRHTWKSSGSLWKTQIVLPDNWTS